MATLWLPGHCLRTLAAALRAKSSCDLACAEAERISQAAHKLSNPIKYSSLPTLLDASASSAGMGLGTGLPGAT
jgi:hypothetical protein